MKLRLLAAARLASVLTCLVWVSWASWKSFRVIGPELPVVGPILMATGFFALVAKFIIVTIWIMFPVFVSVLLYQEGRLTLASRALEALRATGFIAFSGLFIFGILWFPITAALPDSSRAEDGRPSYIEPRAGDLSDEGGSPTIRYGFEAPEDDSDTTNDESNDQPLGHFGTMTLQVFNYQSGNYYTLDGDIDDFELERLYFPKGGWIDFYGCELDEDFTGQCIDEEGRSWSIEGE